MDSVKTVDELVGLVALAPELMHKVALSGYLSFNDVAALSQTCRRMNNIFVDDDYGRDIHYALKGVRENMEARRWRSARFAVGRGWFVGGGERVWKEVASVVVGKGKIELANEEELVGWENVMLAALALSGTRDRAEMWSCDDEHGEKETSLFHVAANVGSERMVDWVLERGGDLEGRDSIDATPLWQACAGGCLAMVRKLVESGADVMAKSRGHRSVLSAASSRGHADVVAFLLGLGVVDVAAEGFGVSSSLYGACTGNYSEVAKLLIEAGADVDVKGKDVFGLMYRACARGYVEIVRLMVDAGAWSGVAKDGVRWANVLVPAAGKGHIDVIRVLLDVGVNVDGLDQVGDTALCRASRFGCVDVVRVLVGEGGADVNQAGWMWKTPLILACEHGEEDMVRVLLELGANTVDEGGSETALDVARRKGRDGIVRVLEEWGRGE